MGPGRAAATVVGTGLVGWVLISIGLGIGVPWFVDGAITVGSAFAVLCLLVGLALIGISVAQAWRNLRSWWRLVLVPWIGLLIVLTFSLSIALAATNVAPGETPETTPADVGLDAVDVTMRASDGVELTGWYVPSTNGAAVVLRHGSGSDRSDVLDHAVVLARNGYGVLMTDARGHGESEGRAMDLGWNGDADIDAAVDLLRTRPDVDPTRIAVVGLSMGGEEAIGAAAADPRIAAVVAEGATGRTAADKAWLSEEYGVRGWLQEQVDRLTYAFVRWFADPDDPISLADAVADAAPRPVLLIAAGDVPEEGQVAERLAEVAPSSVEVWEVEGAGHTDGLDTAPEEWERRVVRFLDGALGTA
ncbi:MAG: alpha/beta fold hydrolase [Ilumatobacteraceae bacterium]|nr:alpha/beta fold hydrolase [Ilumatobacteraceae bacterium]